MKLITAVVKPFTLTNIIEALEEIGVQGITVTEAQGRGRQGAQVEYYRGAKYSSPFVSKAKLEAVVTDAQLDEAIDTIVRTAYTGEIGDGKVWVTAVERAVRVRTKETGDAAILG
ncbi:MULTISPECIES: P-II family nitrogen regulator [unclassified Corynebacterium]|uniref:P-II family nitrogen regulator n=1 Tax=unclassified Corynebacterium TaxID=2624378 RepID=UPI002A909330|nr:P-II family nitrogen regulator [Corynebacterium sp.]MDY5786416.1 P-II family nitrogen regulator [Corynebacterium sp.]